MRLLPTVCFEGVTYLKEVRHLFIAEGLAYILRRFVFSRMLTQRYDTMPPVSPASFFARDNCSTSGETRLVCAAPLPFASSLERKLQVLELQGQIFNFQLCVYSV